MGSSGQPLMKIQPRLLIYSRRVEARQQLQEQLHQLDDEVRDLIIENHDIKMLPALQAEGPQLVILDLEEWTPPDEMALQAVRNRGYDGPVLILTRRVSESAGASYETESVLFFDPANGLPAVKGVVRRLLMGALIASRRHERHSAHQKADIMLEGHRTPLSVEICNISKGGALLKLLQEESIFPGQIFLMSLKLSEVKRAYTVKGKIAWTKPPMFGVEFLSVME